MSPNDRLAEVRRLASKVLLSINQQDFKQNAIQLAIKFKELDDSLSEGQDLPWSWSKRNEV